MKYDAQYLKDCIERIRREAAAHDEKFAGQQAHENCLPRFEKVISSLQQELVALAQHSERVSPE
jgi:hypothetical protein